MCGACPGWHICSLSVNRKGGSGVGVGVGGGGVRVGLGVGVVSEGVGIVTSNGVGDAENAGVFTGAAGVFR
jgi:hypothetical protein